MLVWRVAVCIPSFLLFLMEIIDIRNDVGLKYVGKLRALPRSSHSFMCSLDLCDKNLLSSIRNKGLGQIKIWQGDRICNPAGYKCGWNISDFALWGI